MTYQQEIKYTEINNKIITYLQGQGYVTYFNSKSRIIELFNEAKRLNKTNNSLLKYNDYDSVLKTFSGKCLKKDDVVNFSLFPKKENTTEKLFTYLVLESQYATKQSYEYFKTNA